MEYLIELYVLYIFVEHLMDELETAFKSVRVIDTYLRVVRSFSLTSLSFFKNLHTINGKGIKDSGK